MFKTRHFENFHIPLWLLKDTFWMLEWKPAGVAMIIPAMVVAIIITIKSWNEEGNQWLVNLAVCFWISANSWWMICEFFFDHEMIDYALYPFLMGMIAVGTYYVKRWWIQGRI
jgi:hypothetical protein